MLPQCDSGVHSPSAGVERDLRGANLGIPIILDGTWSFSWKGSPSVPIGVPGAWNNQSGPNGQYGAYGKGTYSLHLRLPPESGPLALYSSRQGTAWSVFADGERIGGSGEVGADSRSHRPAFYIDPLDIPESATADGELLLRIDISNFSDRSGGMWNPFFLGRKTSIRRLWLSRFIFDAFTLAAIVAIGLYHFALFLSRKEDRPSLAFSLVCLLIAVRVASTGEHLLEFFYPGISFEFVRKLEYLSFYLAVPAFLSFLMLALSEPWRRFLPLLIWPVAAIFSLVVLFFPLSVYSQTLVYYFVYFAICLLLGLTIWTRALLRKDPGAFASLLGGLAFAGAAIHDMLYASEVYITTIGNLAGFGLILFLLSQSYLLARIFSRAFRQTRLLSDTLLETNKAYARFVPTDFLNYLEREDIRDVQLGDQTETEMSILFTDIRSFTSLSEKMTPEENFQFLNSYLKRVVPCIARHGGFVDKYIGDAVMALFSGSPESALSAAIEIHREVRQFNQYRQRRGFDPIRIGIGLHCGRLMLGTIGSEDRMESTVISDAVNTASRIERLTRDYGSPILISEEFREALREPEAFCIRLLGRVQVKGKDHSLLVYEVLDGQAQWVLELFQTTKNDFEAGVRAALDGDTEKCRYRMEAVLRENPADQVADLYLRELDGTPG
ncbi:MAG: adenylate/guanylate cyclase domain-containing protein [Leptospiraceae bacterium]|nr:adenylate/guanylate cyclase domain-containing protein [Leptospiraceae bacterium]MCB1303609.1 adenylate/guanylate cyclase domain-containing protein [Leptospiraceae bacterium]